MTASRRIFMRQVGVTLTGLLVSGCVSGPAPEVVEKITCYVVPMKQEAKGVVTQMVEKQVEKVVTATPPSEVSEEWQALRACWLDWPTSAWTPRTAPGRKTLLARHRDALAALVAAGRWNRTWPGTSRSRSRKR